MNSTKIKRGSRKGDNGRLLIIGGSIEYPGAVALAGMAALRAGCDYVTIAAPEQVAWTVNTICPDLVTLKCKGDYLTRQEGILEREYDAVLIGNGLGKKGIPFARRIIPRIKTSLVIDGDAIGCISLDKLNDTLLTPHLGEYQRLKGAIGTNTILLKGPVDQIITRKRTYKNHTGNSYMTKAGTGDVLAGLCAGLRSLGYSALQSARKAAYINGKAGESLNRPFLASELLEEISNLLNET
ncbi:MAG: NAD(P)H-hydrate dehydratase [Candidatus Woesearchaeota archaeon]